MQIPTKSLEKIPPKPRKHLPTEEMGFRHYPHKLCNRDALLILPTANAQWNEETLPYRSIFVDQKTKEVLSCGYPKFFNKGEKPTLYPDPHLYQDWEIETKIDGSLVICDHINGHFSMRTRGSPSHKTQPNWEEFELLPKQHPEIVKFLKENPHLSLLLELETPSNIIVVRQQKTQFTLLDAIDKSTFKLLKKEEIQKALPNLPKPQTHKLNTLEELSQTIKPWVGVEGVVLSYNKNQNRIKLKSDWYLKIHALKSGLNSVNNLLEFYLQKNLPTPQQLFEILENEADFETAQDLLPLQKKITKAGEATKTKISELRAFAHDLRNRTRKDQAQAILQNKKEYSSILFTLLENPLEKPLEVKQIRNILEKFLHA
jgi:hypothetical protein